jgi:hypothetical protein
LSAIVKALCEYNISSPSGKPAWTAKAVSDLLLNRKYIAVVGLEQYFAAQYEKSRRTNLDEHGERKNARYNS